MATVAPEHVVVVAAKPRWLAWACGVLVWVAVFAYHLPFAKDTFLFDDAADYIRASQTTLADLTKSVLPREPNA